MMMTNEEQLDQAMAARDAAERALADATAAVERAKGEHDGSDSTWRAVERAEKLVERRRVELANAQRREREVQLAIDDAQRREDESALDAALASLGPDSFFESVDALAASILPHALALQHEVDRVAGLAEERWERQARARALAKKLGSARSAGRERTADEWRIALGYRLAQLARERGVELAPLQLARPFAFVERAPRTLERAMSIAVPVATLEAAKGACATWSECASRWPRASESTTNEESEETSDECTPTAAQ